MMQTPSAPRHMPLLRRGAKNQQQDETQLKGQNKFCQIMQWPLSDRFLISKNQKSKNGIELLLVYWHPNSFFFLANTSPLSNSISWNGEGVVASLLQNEIVANKITGLMDLRYRLLLLDRLICLHKWFLVRERYVNIWRHFKSLDSYLCGCY